MNLTDFIKLTITDSLTEEKLNNLSKKKVINNPKKTLTSFNDTPKSNSKSLTQKKYLNLKEII